ncbi:TetR/AcrR family transcriptional regulator [Bradyrhizobium sp. Ash2021]|uniref:TetR/AcrR family transcriptional regulator n=1 Tax=Bradyrhizobium sp. Ash2021 TaxID=2954771 RepID=UPI002814E591|nr:TetR/AcrR family transcriptional regulator [Bradyrhizobium sp. Ash2021]WMT74627.1 TetR/AcrR family transcriptional regulator [Bradyrhizobium sp. Ash2021]
MARPREFDETVVLDAAVHCFWSQGYEATSVRDLAQSMGITGASLYNAFGDKRSLYKRSLDHYVSNNFGDRVQRFESKLPPFEALEAFFSEIIERSITDKKRKGCMLVNSAVELAPHDKEFCRVVDGVLGEVEAFFRRCMEAGQTSGMITTAQSHEDLARLLLSVVLGIRVLARSRPKRELLEGAVRSVFALLAANE